jgi:hypothetical protein
MSIAQALINTIKYHKDKINGPHFIFSAENPIHPKYKNLHLNHEQVLSNLQKAGFDAHPIYSCFDIPDKSILIYLTDPTQINQLLDLAFNLGQESCIVSDGNKHILQFINGDFKGSQISGEGSTWYNKKPYNDYCSLPGEIGYFSHNFQLEKSETKIGVDKNYIENAKSHCDILFPVTIKGQKKLEGNIGLHMSLKIFNNVKEFEYGQVKEKVKELNIISPDPSELEFSPEIFHSEINNHDFYMLIINKLPKNYEEFYNFYKDRGTVYKKFMPHITISKEIYDDILKNGIRSEEIEFGPLTIENGTKVIYQFDEELEKSLPKYLATAALAGSLMASPIAKEPTAPVSENNYSRTHMLRAISSIESSGGKNTNHKPVLGIHQGESAVGEYALMPSTIRETVRLNPNIRKEHQKVQNLHGQDLHNYIKTNPKFMQQVADAHMARLEHHFGQDPNKLAYAWLNGIRGTYKEGKKNADFSKHWYVQRIKGALKGK